jgi:cytochrome P450
MTITEKSLFQQVNAYANRANPYPLYAEMRKTPIYRESNGNYVVSSYRLISELLHDPRLGSDIRKGPDHDEQVRRAKASKQPLGFIRLDPPDHDRLRRQVMRQFGPPHTIDLIDNMKGELVALVDGLLDRLQGKTRIDVVDDFAHPFPVTVICKLLGVPQNDEPRFQGWADVLALSLDPPLEGQESEQATMSPAQAAFELGQYMVGLIEVRRKNPGEDMLSRLITDEGPDGPLTVQELVTTAGLLLVAGHETTVNLITNGTLTLLRHPHVLERLRQEPDLAVPLVEEVLRYEPPAQFNGQRIALADITLDGVTIPRGARVYTMLAAGNRDPERFADPERFIPDRQDNQHFGFGNGIHYCFGAPLARLEVQSALLTLARRLVNPRLVIDPPPYRQAAILRGPRHLLIDVDGI